MRMTTAILRDDTCEDESGLAVWTALVGSLSAWDVLVQDALVKMKIFSSPGLASSLPMEQVALGPDVQLPVKRVYSLFGPLKPSVPPR